MPKTTKSQKEYKERIHQAIDYINKHLADEINLDKLSEAACFSPFHFHRIFTAFMDETPRDFIARLRLEHAANQLFTRPNDSIIDIAYNSGFSSLSTFSRAFKKHYGCSPSKFLNKHKEDFHSLNKPEIHHISDLSKIDLSNMKTQVLPSMHIAYTETLEGYSRGVRKAWTNLYKYAEARDLINSKTLHIGVAFDNPGITPVLKCRYRACINVPKELIIKRGEVKTDDFNGGKYALLHFKGNIENITFAYSAIYAKWLPNSGYIPSDKPLLEIYPHNFLRDFNPNCFEYDIALPIEPL